MRNSKRPCRRLRRRSVSQRRGGERDGIRRRARSAPTVAAGRDRGIMRAIALDLRRALFACTRCAAAGRKGAPAGGRKQEASRGCLRVGRAGEVAYGGPAVASRGLRVLLGHDVCRVDEFVARARGRLRSVFAVQADNGGGRACGYGVRHARPRTLCARPRHHGRRVAVGRIAFVLPGVFLRRVFACRRAGRGGARGLLVGVVLRHVAELLRIGGRIAHCNLHSPFGGVFSGAVLDRGGAARHLVGAVLGGRAARPGKRKPVPQPRRNRTVRYAASFAVSPPCAAARHGKAGVLRMRPGFRVAPRKRPFVVGRGVVPSADGRHGNGRSRRDAVRAVFRARFRRACVLPGAFPRCHGCFSASDASRAAVDVRAPGVF